MPDASADLSRLHDLAPLEAVPWWPLAPGWIVLLGLALVSLGFGCVRAWRSWRANAYRREALRALVAAEDTPAVAAVLRRAALAIAPREEVAGLRGRAWVDWLERRVAQPPAEPVREALAGAIYAPAAGREAEAAVRAFAEDWISTHCRQC